MKMKDIQKIAKKKGVNAGNMNETHLIRAIQKAEGNNECFATASVQTCGQTNCLWHKDCALFYAEAVSIDRYSHETMGR